MAWWTVLWNIIPGCLQLPGALQPPRANSESTDCQLSRIMDFREQFKAVSQLSPGWSLFSPLSLSFPQSSSSGLLVLCVPHMGHKTFGHSDYLSFLRTAEWGLGCLICIKCFYQNALLIESGWFFFCDLFSNNTFNVLNKNLSPLHYIDKYVVIFFFISHLFSFVPSFPSFSRLKDT